MAGQLSYKTVSAYEVLLTSFDDMASSANRGLVGWTDVNNSVRTVPAEPWHATLEVFVHLRDWQFREDRVGVLIRARETIHKDTLVLVKSTVQLSYYDIDNKQNSATLLHNMHFDYGEPEPNHPIFHAQLCPEPVEISESDRDTVQFDYTVQPPTRSRCFKGTRIPTSDMTLPSVLLCLSADAVQDQAIFLDFLKEVRELQERLPRPASDATSESLIADRKTLRSHHWYAHMPVKTD